MNAQKAQEALENYFSAKNKFETEVYKSFETIEEFIDQSNAKPKTLEELGWACLERGRAWALYYVQREIGDIRTFLKPNEVFFYFDCPKEMPLSREELIAVVEAMKEFEVV